MKSSDSVAPHFKDPAIEKLLNEVNSNLYSLERRLTAQFNEPERPVVLIAGLPRTGTTLLMQLLSASFRVGYVSNLIARFWRAPYIGALIARDLKQRQAEHVASFVSELGTTYGYDGPHEFGFFWHQWFPGNETHQTSAEDLQTADFGALRREIAAVEDAFQSPMVFKNPIVFNLHIDTLAQVLPSALFIICQREPVFVAQSILESRMKRYGTGDSWLGVKPKEYVWLKDLSPTEQVAGQMYFTQMRIEETLAGLPSDRYLTIGYESLCRTPWEMLERVRIAIEALGGRLNATGFTPKSLEPANSIRLNNRELKQVHDALARFRNGTNLPPTEPGS